MYSIVTRHLYNLLSDPPNKSSTHLTPYTVTTIPLITFPLPPRLFCAVHFSCSFLLSLGSWPRAWPYSCHCHFLVVLGDLRLLLTFCVLVASPLHGVPKNNSKALVRARVVNICKTARPVPRTEWMFKLVSLCDRYPYLKTRNKMWHFTSVQINTPYIL